MGATFARRQTNQRPSLATAAELANDAARCPIHNLSPAILRRSFQIGRRRIEVLRGVSLEVQHGESIFLCGASGAGKTTLLYTLAGLERPESGEVEFEGQKLYRNGESALARLRNQKMGFVFQGYFLLPELTALENVMLPGMIGRHPGKRSLRAKSRGGRPGRSAQSSPAGTFRRRTAAGRDRSRPNERSGHHFCR